MHIPINYILHAPLISRQYILRHSIQTYQPLKYVCVLHFTMYFYKYCLILLIFHRTVITVLEIRKLTQSSNSLSNVLSTIFLLAFITVSFAPEQRAYNCKLSDNIYSTVIWFSVSILSLYDGLDQLSYFYRLLNPFWLPYLMVLRLTALKTSFDTSLQALSIDLTG